MSDQIDLVKLGDLAYELAEARSEIRRHHEDFQKIREALRGVMAPEGYPPLHPKDALRLYGRALREIRGIVG